MAIHLTFTVDVDPHDPAHQAWLEKFRDLIEELPNGSTAQEKTVPRNVSIHELREYLRLHGDYGKELNNVTRRMWNNLVRVCCGGASRPNAEMPKDETDQMELPLTALKLLTRAHFQGGRLMAKTRMTLLAFIASLS